ncbi:unnamed protein product [Sphagnum balticum]
MKTPNLGPLQPTQSKFMFKPWLLLEDYDPSSSFSLSSGHGFSLRIMILAHFQVMRKCLMPCRNKLPCFLVSLSLTLQFSVLLPLLQVSTISPVHSPHCVFIFINSRALFNTHEVEEGPNQLTDLDINALDMFPIVQLDQFHFGLI